MVLTVRDQEGKLLSGARAVVYGASSHYASPDSRIRLRLRSESRLPVPVEVSAPGYASQTVSIRPNDYSRIDVYLVKLPQKKSADGRTISVDELSGDDIQKAVKLHRRAVELLRAGQPAEARTLLFDAERYYPSSASIKNSIGVSLLRERKFLEAAQWLEAAYRMEPSNPDYAANVGLLRWMQRRYGECYALLRRAVELGCETESVHYLLGVLALQQQQWKLSRKQLSTVSPERFPFSNLFLSVALHGLDRADDAYEKYQEFLKQNPVPLFEAPHR